MQAAYQGKALTDEEKSALAVAGEELSNDRASELANMIVSGGAFTDEEQAQEAAGRLADRILTRLIDE